MNPWQGVKAMDEKISLEIDGRVAQITINRERYRNALDDESLIALRESLRDCKYRDIGAVVLKGAGLKAFSAGSDLKEMATQTPEEMLNHTELGQMVSDAIEEHPAPVIAAIEGFCLGGGMEIALACDCRIVGAGSKLGLPELALNALPSWGGTVRLPRIVGVGRAREIVIFGRTLSAEEAVAWGIASRAVPQGEAAAAALELARTFEDRDRRAVGLAKSLLSFGYGAPTRTGRHLEYLADMSQLQSESLGEGVKAFAGSKNSS